MTEVEGLRGEFLAPGIPLFHKMSKGGIPMVIIGKKKPFLGGYRSKQEGNEGAEYHNASSQTDINNHKIKDTSNLRTRDTQTYDMVSRSLQTYREMGTQMKRSDLYMEDQGDTEVMSGPYFTAAGLVAHKREKAIVIQRYWRAYLARSLVWYLQDARYQEDKRELEEARAKRDMDEDQRLYELRRRMNPRTRKDFEVLYNELDQWTKKEIARVHQNKSLDEAQRLEATQEILDKETKVLQAIDRLKVKAQKEYKLDREIKTLQMMALPKRWQLGDGEVTEVHTAFTIRAQELLDLYKAVNTLGLSIDDRLDTLWQIKWTVQEFPCSLTDEICDLIDREADLLDRGRSESSLGGLRQRISNLLLDFIKRPEFNSEAARFQPVQKDKIEPKYAIQIGGSSSSYSNNNYKV